MLDKNKVKLGIAPIAWTNDDMPDLGAENTFEQCISEMALAGFTGCEVGNKYPRDTKVLKKALELRGMQICNAWFSSFLITKPYEEVEKEIKKDLPSRLHARRQMLKVLYSVTEVPAENAGKKKNTKEVDLVAKLFDEVAPKYAGRNGGYTRIIKIGQRKGDAAMEVVLELV